MANLGQWIFAPIIGIESEELQAVFLDRLLLSQHVWVARTRAVDLDVLGALLLEFSLDSQSQWGVYLSPPDGANEIWVAEQVVKVLMLFDLLTSGDPTWIPFTVWVGRKSRQTLAVTDYGTIWRSPREGIGHLKSGLSEQHFGTTWRMLERACSEDTGLPLCLERLTRGIRHSDPRDQVLDLAIALESIVRASTEVLFRFSLYLSLISSREPKEREEAFRDFRLLYELRCSVAHGDSKGFHKKLHKWEAKKDAIVSRAKGAVWYYVQFLNLPRATRWQDHLRGLALGAESSIGGSWNGRSDSFPRAGG